MIRKPVIALTLFFFGATVQAEELKLCFGSTSYHSLFKELAPVFEKQTGIKILNVADLEAGSVSHIRDMANGKCEGAIGNLSFEEMIQLMKDNGIIVDKSKLTHRVIGRELLKIVANPKVGLKTLRMEQVKGLFDGSITNWKAIGGVDQAVKVIYASNKAVTAKAFRQIVLGKGTLVPSAPGAPDFKDVVERVVKTEGMVSFIPNAIPVGKAVVLDTDEKIGTPKTLVSIGRPSERLNKLIDFIRNVK